MSATKKVAIVTGAGSGIGKASALAFARAGAKVLATDINAAALESLAGEGVETRILDVLSDEAVRQTVSDAGPVDVCGHARPFPPVSGSAYSRTSAAVGRCLRGRRRRPLWARRG